MIDIYQGCYFDDIFLKSDTQIDSAFIYNVSTGKSQELTLSTGDEYIYDVVLTDTQTAQLECGVYHLEVFDDMGRMIYHKDNLFRVLPSSKSEVN